jgi:nucleoside-diphosphate-sugar epimerase
MEKRKILVAGGADYLGSVLCDTLLRADYKVTVLDRLIYGDPGLFHLCSNPDFDFRFLYETETRERVGIGTSKSS